MRDIRDVLREKELEAQEVRRQVEALRLVAPLLEEPHDRKPGQSDEIIWKDGTTGLPVRSWP